MAFATDFDVLLLARAIQGATLPAFISVGASVVTRLAPPAQQGKGLARANIGFVLGILLALPAGTALAQNGDWRVPFLVLAIAPFPAIALIRWEVRRVGDTCVMTCISRWWPAL